MNTKHPDTRKKHTVSARMSTLLKGYGSPPVAVLSIACTGALLAVFIVWLIGSQGTSALGKAGASLSVLLFWTAGIQLIPLWVRDWGGSEPCIDAGGEWTRRDRRIMLRVCLTLLLLTLFTLLFTYLIQFMHGERGSFKNALSVWSKLDSASYMDIAENWYLSEGPLERLVTLVFPPGYPLLIRLVNYAVGNSLYSGLIVSAVAFAGAGAVLYRLLRLDMDSGDAVRVIKYMCLLPGAFFFAAPMTESLFLLISVSCIYFTRKKRWLWACVLGGLAVFTRALGLILLVPVLYEMISSAVAERRQGGALRLKTLAPFLYTLILVGGFAAYCYINYRVSGDPFKFVEYQREHWSMELGWFFNTPSYQLEYAVSSYQAQEYPIMFGLFIPGVVCSLCALAAVAFSVKKLRPSYTAYFLIYYAIAIGSAWLLSGPRYITVMFPVPMALAYYTKNRSVDGALTVLMTAASVLYLCMFVLGWQVW